MTRQSPPLDASATAPANKVVEFLTITVTNESNATNCQMAIEFCRITTLGSPTGYTVVTLRLSCAQPAAREREERLEGLTRSRFALLASWTSHSSHGIVDLSQQ